MRILQVVPCFPPAYAFGGPVKVAYQISKELVKRGHEVTVYTTDAKDLTTMLSIESPKLLEGVKVYYFKNVSMKFVKWSKLFVTPNMLSKTREKTKLFDVIHLHEYRTFQNIVIHHYARKYGVPYVLQAHGSIPRIIVKQRLKWIYDVFFGYRLLKDASKVVALSQMEAEQYRGMGVPEEKMAVIPDGIDPSEYENLPPKGKFKAKYRISEQRKIILYLGRIHRIKGIEFLIKAYAYLVKNTRLSDDMLVMVGPDDGYLSEAKSLVGSLGLNNNILFTGPLYGKEKLEAYVDASVVVCPSLYGVFDLVPIEAAFCGKPLIVSNLSTYGLAKCVEKGNFGLLVYPSNLNELKNALLLLLKDRNLATKLGSHGRTYAFDNLTLERMVDRLEKLYADVC